MKKITTLLLTTIAFITATGCERQALDYNYSPNCNVKVTIDWSQSRLTTHGATAIFYPQDGGKAITAIMSEPNGEIIKLPKGTYNVIVFNQTMDEFSYLGFRGTESYATFEIFVKPTANKAAEENIIANPDNCAVAKQENFEITSEMVAASRDHAQEITLSFTPKPVVSTMKISLFAKNVYMIKAAKGNITGMANSYSVSKGKNNSSTASHSFSLTKITLDNSGELNGFISGEITTLGLPDQISKASEILVNTLTVSFLLVDNKTIIEKTYHIENKISDDEQTAGIKVEVGTSAGSVPGEEASEEDKPIEIPEVKPDEGESGGGGGMDADVGKWDEIEITIPV
jgi:Domain of unknown function (DUF5119)